MTNQGMDINVTGAGPEVGLSEWSPVPAVGAVRALRDAYSAAYGPARKAWMNDADAHTEGLKAMARAVIENAPHENTRSKPCNAALFESAACTCWKADAL